MKLTVGIYATHVGGRLPRLMKELEAAKIPYVIGGMGGRLQHRQFTWAKRQAWYRDFARKTRGKICFVDAYDMKLVGTREELFEKIPKDKILCCTELQCWPDPTLAPHWPRGVFPNGGGQAGPAGLIADVLEDAKFKPEDFIFKTLDHEMRSDQYFWQKLTVSNKRLIKLDEKNEIWQCLYFGESFGLPGEEPVNGKGKSLFPEGKRWRNTRTGGLPVFLHGNGRSKIPKGITNGVIVYEGDEPEGHYGERGRCQCRLCKFYELEKH